MSNRYIKETADYHYQRICKAIADSDPEKQLFKVNFIGDRKQARLELALDTRRLAEILAVKNAWDLTYGNDEKKFHDYAMNDFIDILYRMKKVSPDWESPIKGDLDDTIKQFAGKRFRARHVEVDSKTNDQLKQSAPANLQFAFLVTSKILHADEYGVYSHITEESLGWFALIMVSKLVCKEYTNQSWS